MMCITIHIIYQSLHSMDVSDNRTLLHLRIQSRSRLEWAESIQSMYYRSGSLRYHWPLLGPLLGCLRPVTNPVHLADCEGHSVDRQGWAVQKVLRHPHSCCDCILLFSSVFYRMLCNIYVLHIIMCIIIIIHVHVINCIC